MTEKYKIYFSRIQNLKLQALFRVNCGGCGCFALIMLEIFKRIGIKQLNIIYCNPCRGLAPGHVLLSDGKYYYDCDGIHEKDKIESRYRAIKTVTEEDLKDCISTEYNWNSRFKRYNLDRIRELVTETVETVETALVELEAIA